MMLEHYECIPSLSLNWLPNNIQKGLPHVQIAWVSNCDFNGAYYTKQDGTVFDRIDLSKAPLILVRADTLIDEASVIAHEYMHHWQHYNWGELPNNYKTWQSCLNASSYDKAIIEYFNSNPTEMGALAFEYAMSKNDINEYWVELIVKDGEPICTFPQFMQ